MPTFVGAGSFHAGSGGAAPGNPAEYAIDDVWLLFVETANQAVPAMTGLSDWALVTTPTGVGTAGGLSSTRLTAYWRRVVSLSEGTTFTNDPGDHACAIILGFRGCVATGDPFEVLGADTLAVASTAISIPGGTTLGDNRLVIAACAGSADGLAGGQVSGEANADLANLVALADGWGSGGNGGGIVVYSGEKATEGTVAATTATGPSSVQERLCLALVPT